MSKFDELYLKLKSNPTQIFCFVETYFKEFQTNNFILSDSPFNLIRCDRTNKKKGGGACIFLPKFINFLKVETPSFSGIEFCAADLYITSSVIRLVNVYIPPKKSVSLISLNKFFDYCLTLFDSSPGFFLMCGDFNLPSREKWRVL